MASPSTTTGSTTCEPAVNPVGHPGKIRANTDRYGASRSSAAKSGDATRTNASANGRNAPPPGTA